MTEAKWGSEWAAWAEDHPPRVVQTKPVSPWYESDDYIDAVKTCDNCELAHEIACEVVTFEGLFYVMPKNCV